MGMFDKDKLYGGERLMKQDGGHFDYNDEFIVHGVGPLKGTIQTDIGDANKTLMAISKIDSPDSLIVVGTLSQPIYNKALEAESSDFPAVVKVMQVPASNSAYNDATVIQFVRAWDGDVPDSDAIAHAFDGYELANQDTVPY